LPLLEGRPESSERMSERVINEGNGIFFTLPFSGMNGTFRITIRKKRMITSVRFACVPTPFHIYALLPLTLTVKKKCHLQPVDGDTKSQRKK
jgi:hypothetical protein